MTTVVLLRHGRTSANSSGVLAGRTAGVKLDEVGERQARDAAARLAQAPLAAIVTSPLQRCRQTAATVHAEHLQVPLSTHAGLIECGYGEWSGRKLADLAKEPLWKTVQTQPSAVRFPGGEAMIEMAARAQQTIRDTDRALTAEHGPDAVWVAVSHGDVIKAVLAEALGMHLDSFQRIMVDPASISVVRYGADRPFVACMNTVSGDLTAMLTPPKRRGGRRSTARTTDAAVGGGLGSHGR